MVRLRRQEAGLCYMYMMKARDRVEEEAPGRFADFITIPTHICEVTSSINATRSLELINLIAFGKLLIICISDRDSDMHHVSIPQDYSNLASK